MNYPQKHLRMKHDAGLVWRPGRIWLPALRFTGMLGAAGVNAGQGAGAPVEQEISTFGVNAILLDTAADEIGTYMAMPDDIDLSKRIYARVHWTTGSTTTADTIDFKVWYKPIVFESTALTLVGNTGGTALDTVIAQDTVPTTTAYTWNVTSEGYLDAGKLADNVQGLLWTIELDAFAAGLTEDKLVLGLEIRYTPRRLWGPDGMSHEAKAPAWIAAKHYNN